MSCSFIRSSFSLIQRFRSLSLFFLGILGYDVFLDEQGDVQQNLTVMTLSDNTGKTKGCNSNIKWWHICPTWVSVFVSLASQIVCCYCEYYQIVILPAAVFFGTGNCSFKIVHGSFFLQQRPRPRCLWSLSEIGGSVIEIFWDEVFLVRNAIKNGQSWCLAVICRKRSAFDMQFHFIVVSIFLKTCVTDHGDSSSRLLERRVWLVCIEALLLAVL